MKNNGDEDLIFNGANDNASGVAAVLALAEHFEKTNYNERSILFVAFTAEEIGLIGSNYFGKNIDPELIIREGEPVKEILSFVTDNPDIGILVLGAGTDNNGPGPLVSQLSKSSGTFPIPVTIVPGNLSKEQLEAIT